MPPKTIYSKIWWTVLLLGLCVSAFLVGITFLNPSSVGNPDFVSNTNLWAAVWAINFLMVLALSFILARDLVKVYFEYQARRPGSRIKSKLTTTFILFSLFPALIMSFLAFGLINRNLRLWFTSPSEQLLGSSEQILTSFYQLAHENLQRSLEQAADQIAQPRSTRPEALGRLAEARGLQALALFDPEGGSLVQSPDWISPEGFAERLQSLDQGEPDLFFRYRLFERQQADTDLLIAGQPVKDQQGQLAAWLLGQSVLPQSVEFHRVQVQQAREKFDQLKAGVNQVEANYFSILVLSTLTLVFGFVWLATYLSKRITVPLEALAEGAEQLAEGHFDHRVEVQAVDELGILVDSFNRMAAELQESRLKLERANAELRSINQQLDERRRYTETILQNIGTGVISLDEKERVRTVNQAAVHILGIDREASVGRTLGEILGTDLGAELLQLKELAELSGVCRKDLSYRRDEQQRFLAVTVTSNPHPSGDASEFLIVLDDLTELIRAEKFAAWQEVARRLAHEIKNPLTPIQLSADRIAKRFAKLPPRAFPQMEEFGRVLEEGLRIIGAESEMLKNLVQEFSRFARLPMFRPVETDVNELLAQTLTHYDGVLQSIRVRTDLDPRLGTVRLDPEQMRRVFVNLIDNALDALAEDNGERILSVATRLNPDGRSLSIEFADTGCGIAPQDYENLFLPYFSTKKKGTGLGLAIVRQIVSEHQGQIRAEPNRPRGMKFTLDMPMR